MVWQQWFFIIVFVLSIIFNVLQVGQKREPLTPGAAAVCVVTALVYIAVILSNLACRAALSFAACLRLHRRFHLNLTATGASPQTASRHFGHWRNACPSTTFCLTSGAIWHFGHSSSGSAMTSSVFLTSISHRLMASRSLLGPPVAPKNP